MTTRKIELDVVVDHLGRKGMKVLDRQWKSAEGELDLVAAERGSLVVVALVPRIPTSLPLATPRARRLRRLAVAWMNAHGVRFDRIRVDVISVTLLPYGQSNLEHVRAVDE